MKNISISIIILTIFLFGVITTVSSCITIVQQNPQTQEQIDSAKRMNEADGIIKQAEAEEAARVHLKHQNADPLVSIEGYFITKTDGLHWINFTIKNNSDEYIHYLQLHWKLYDKSGAQIDTAHHIGYGAEDFAPGETKNMGWEIAKDLKITEAKVGLDTVRLSSDTTWDYDRKEFSVKMLKKHKYD